MKKIGFIDYYLDEWHANNYPGMIRGNERAKALGLEVCYAYAKTDVSPYDGVTTDEWCAEHKVEKCRSIEELVDKSDFIAVLSPDNPELHYELSEYALKSGKPTYIDKTFAPDLAAAERLFAIARQSGTPCYSTSALRFAAEYRDIRPDEVTAVSCWGPNDFDTYSVHQLEPLMMLMGAEPARVMWLDGEKWMSLAVQFRDGRCATLSCFAGGSPFVTNVSLRSGNRLITVESDFFAAFIEELCRFYQTGEVRVPHRETLAIMAVRGAGLLAAKTPGVWVDVPSPAAATAL